MSLSAIDYPNSTTATLPQASTSSSTPLPQPRTPSFGATATPNVSSPDSPSQLETPHVSLPSTGGGSMKGGGGMQIDSSILEGLGYGGVGAETTGKMPLLGGAGDMSDDDELFEGLATGSNPVGYLSKGRALSPDDEGENTGFPDQTSLRGIQERLDALNAARSSGEGEVLAQRDELAGMVKSLLAPALEQLPFLQGQVDAQRDTIVTIQDQAKLSEQLMKVERERHTAERAGWQAETRALVQVRDAEIAAGTRPKKLLDLDVGYHQELEAANKRLEMDNRLMAPRLADTQRQIDKLVNELRHLRSHVVLSSQSLGDLNAPFQLPQQQSQGVPMDRRKSGSPTKAETNHATMGDARTEHLLLAARKVRTMRQTDDRVGRVTLDELKRGGVVGPDGGLGYSEGYGGPIEDDEDEYDSEIEEEKALIALQSDRRTSVIGKGKGKGTTSAQATPLLPRAKRSSKRSLPPPTTPRPRSQAHPPETTPGGSNFSDLLRAAEMATRPATPAGNPSRTPHVPLSAMSATRSTTRAREESTSDRGSPTKRTRRDPPPSAIWSRGRRISGMEVQDEEMGEERGPIEFPNASTPDPTVPDSQQSHPEAFALDLLAQASQLDIAQSASQDSGSGKQLSSAARFGGMLQEGGRNIGSSPGSTIAGDGGLAPAIDLKSESSAAPAPIEDHQIDPSLSSLPRPGTAAPTPPPRQRAQSFASDVHTPARTYTQHPYPTPDNPLDETPGQWMSPPSASRADMLFNELPPGAFASPTGATVPGLGKYVHLTSSMPARRVRSPYLKWTVEEDELLARAVALHGEKWDLVSKGVPTRSYHQVRQRWLRKTGAFDKKPLSAEHPHGMSGLGQEEDEEETSPTPGGRTPIGKKRKALAEA